MRNKMNKLTENLSHERQLWKTLHNKMLPLKPEKILFRFTSW